MKTKEQQKREADERRRRHEKEQLRITRDIVAGRRHDSGLLKTETRFGTTCNERSRMKSILAPHVISGPRAAQTIRFRAVGRRVGCSNSELQSLIISCSSRVDI